MLKKHILIVEDEGKITQLLCDYLTRAGYRATTLGHGGQVISYVRGEMPDLILLDIMLPGMDGMAICRELRQFSSVPVIMITARVDEIDRLLGLELGADDYICKPFSPREVVARVKAVLRRGHVKTDGHKIALGPFVLDEETYEAKAGGHLLDLTASEFKLLKVLMNRPNRVFSRSELIERVLGYNFEGYERTIDSHIKNLRKKIAKFYPDQEFIGSIYGVGYKFSIKSI